MSADDTYEPDTSAAQDNDYKSRTGQSDIPVQSDDAPVEGGVDPATADSDEQLAADDKEAINKDNIIDSKTRGAEPAQGTYKEPGDEEVS